MSSYQSLRDKNGLVLAVEHHALEGALGNGEDVGRDLVPALAHVDLHGSLGVDGEPLHGRKGKSIQNGNDAGSVKGLGNKLARSKGGGRR